MHKVIGADARDKDILIVLRLKRYLQTTAEMLVDNLDGIYMSYTSAGDTEELCRIKYRLYHIKRLVNDIRLAFVINEVSRFVFGYKISDILNPDYYDTVTYFDDKTLFVSIMRR